LRFRLRHVSCDFFVTGGRGKNLFLECGCFGYGTSLATLLVSGRGK